MMDFKERLKRKNAFDASLVYGTREFNLLTRRDRHIKFRVKSDNQWTDKKTGIIADKFAEKRKCPLCANSDSETLFIKYGFPHLKCKICGLVYVNPILDKKEYAKLCSQEYSWEAVLENKEQVKMQVLEANYYLDVVQPYLKKKQNIRICDVGCGPGTFLEQAKKRGYSVFGIEPNQRCRRFLDQKGIDVIVDFFPFKRSVKEKFDCVFLISTLEHLRQPLLVVREIKKILLPGGLIYISVPSIDALVNRIMQEKAGTFGGHAHLQFFSVATLSRLLKSANFKVLEYETTITEIGVIKNYLNFKDPYFGDAPDNLTFLIPELIHKRNLARNLNMLGQLKK